MYVQNTIQITTKFTNWKKHNVENRIKSVIAIASIGRFIAETNCFKKIIYTRRSFLANARVELDSFKRGK